MHLTLMYFAGCGIAALLGTVGVGAFIGAENPVIPAVALALVLLMLAYFAPTYQAAKRQKHLTPIIFGLNLCFGWTLVAWFLLLMWGMTAEETRARAAAGKLTADSGLPGRHFLWR